VTPANAAGWSNVPSMRSGGNRLRWLVWATALSTNWSDICFSEPAASPPCCSAPWATAAQTNDPVSGDWGVDDRRLLALKFDGKDTVTGTIHVFSQGVERASAPIAEGSFDRATRLLRLAGELIAPDGQAMPYAIEGTLEGDVLAVSYRFGANEGSETLRKLPADRQADASIRR
jgi:hypothetical protein